MVQHETAVDIYSQHAGVWFSKKEAVILCNHFGDGQLDSAPSCMGLCSDCYVL